MTSKIENKKVLLVEDDFFLAVTAEEVLTSIGSNVTVANTVNEAISIVNDNEFDCAIIDYNLGLETALPITEKLDCIEVPYAIVSGAERSELEKSFGNLDKVFHKPVDYCQVMERFSS